MTLWSSVSSMGHLFKWYHRDVLTMTLSNTVLAVAGNRVATEPWVTSQLRSKQALLTFSAPLSANNGMVAIDISNFYDKGAVDVEPEDAEFWHDRPAQYDY